MELPIELKLATERLVTGMSQSSMTDRARELSKRYMNESGTGKSLLNKKDDASVYSLMRMPATFGAVASVIEQVCQISDFVPRSLLDAGAGTGAGSWAASQYFMLDRITCLEREDAMAQIGRQLMTEAEDKVLREARWVESDLTAEAEKYQRTGGTEQEADLVIASYVLNEMNAGDRIKVVRWLWESTKKMFIIIEPGTPVGSDNIRRIRDYLIEEGAHIVAPCPAMGRCPVKGDDWCHFSCRVQRGKLHRMLKSGDVPYEDEKFSYIAVSREECTKQDKPYGRIMRHPLTEKGRVTLSLCTGEDIIRKAVTKKDGDIYKKAKKVSCGDMLAL